MTTEKNLEVRCRRLALDHDGELVKLSTRKGLHDRLLMLPSWPNGRGYLVLVEFKKDEKARLQPLQQWWQTWCDGRRIPAFRVWTFEQFEAIIRDRP